VAQHIDLLAIRKQTSHPSSVFHMR